MSADKPVYTHNDLNTNINTNQCSFYVHVSTIYIFYLTPILNFIPIIPGLTHLKATAIQVTLAGKPAIVLAAYLSPSRPLIGADLTACFGWALAILMAGDLNAKHLDWNSRLSNRRGKLLRDYADANSCLIFGPKVPTTNPHNPSAYPDILDCNN